MLSYKLFLICSTQRLTTLFPKKCSSSAAATLSLIHELILSTSVYTPGIFFRPHPMPQLTIPNRTWRSECKQVMGPPLSPWQASLDPSTVPAQIMFLLTSPDSQSGLLQTFLVNVIFLLFYLMLVVFEHFIYLNPLTNKQ